MHRAGRPSPQASGGAWFALLGTNRITCLPSARQTRSCMCTPLPRPQSSKPQGHRTRSAVRPHFSSSPSEGKHSIILKEAASCLASFVFSNVFAAAIQIGSNLARLDQVLPVQVPFAFSTLCEGGGETGRSPRTPTTRSCPKWQRLRANPAHRYKPTSDSDPATPKTLAAILQLLFTFSDMIWS
jgi:hypothetical protein